MSNNGLEINLNEEYKIKIENGNDFEGSIFRGVYKAALLNVLEILKQSDKSISSKYDDFNNIIAFTGERGKGKSSSMISFRDALVDKENREKHSAFFDKTEFQSLKNKNFDTIDIVDPSLFRGGESLFEIILAKMFQCFQTEIRNSSNRISQDKKRLLLQNFQNVFENLQIINSDRKDLYKKESIEALSRLATSSNLRECFKDLLSSYLSFFNNKADFLVVAIDDFDLNIAGAYEMLEDIRQFLIQSNVIILIACKIEQLKEAVVGYFKSINVQFELEKKAKKYVDKIIPFSRRNNLPDVQKLDKKDFRIVRNGGVVFENKDGSFKISILKLIYDEINLFQALDILNQNSIIPETIRQTQNLASVIFSENRDTQLLGYVLEESKFDIQLHSIIEELDGVSDDLFLLFLLQKLLKLENDKQKGISDRLINTERAKNLRRLSNTNLQDRVSIGDINFVLKEYENILSIDDYSLYHSLNYLKIYISLRIKKIAELAPKYIRFGYFNQFIDLLPREAGRYSRDYFEFNKSVTDDLSTLTINDRIYFSLWVRSLGEGYLDYRQHLNKDIYVDWYVNGTLSPFALLHNIFNLNELSRFFDFDSKHDFVKELKAWFQGSKFIKQLSNPSFDLKLIEYLRIFRHLEIKEVLPDNNYFDTISLLFVYGIIYSLDKIESIYKVEGLVADFLDNRVFSHMVISFNEKNYTYRAVSDLRKKYQRLNDKTDQKIFSNDVVDLINIQFAKSKELVDSSLDSKYIRLPRSVAEVLKDLSWALNNRDITSRTVTTRAAKLREIEVGSSIAEYLDKVKYGLNSKNEAERIRAREEIVEYINKLLNG